jgi:hypothetical protein
MAKHAMSADAVGCEVKVLEDGSAGSLEFKLDHPDVRSVRLNASRHLLERIRDLLRRELEEHKPAGRESTGTA